MSPILVRPVREQLEHDRVIRLLQAKYKRKYDVAINPGNERTAAVGTGPAPWYPDLVLHSLDRGRKLLGVVEVETAESVNNLEAMSQWATFGRMPGVFFHLYIPVSGVDVARRLCTDLQVPVAEIWAYHGIGDQMRFALVHKAEVEPVPEPRPKAAAARATAAERKTRTAPAAVPSSRARAARPASSGRPAATATSRRSAVSAKTSGKSVASRRTAVKTASRRAPATAAKAHKRR